MLLRNMSIVETMEAIFVVLKVYFVENLINEKNRLSLHAHFVIYGHG